MDLLTFIVVIIGLGIITYFILHKLNKPNKKDDEPIGLQEHIKAIEDMGYNVQISTNKKRMFEEQNRKKSGW